MQTIGDKLEESRKRQGISVREAAEATKIRTDFLLNFENDNFEFDLPEVYRRGFLKLYAQYLRMDIDKLMTDYQAVILGRNKNQKRDNKEFFGRMDLSENRPTLGGKESEPPVKSPSTSRPKGKGIGTIEDGPAQAIEQDNDNSMYWKIGLIFGAALAFILLLGLIIKVLVSDSNDADGLNSDEPRLLSDATASTDSDLPEIVDSVTPIIIRADGDTHILVRQENDQSILYKGLIEAGQELSLDRNGPVRVVSPTFHQLTIVVDGETFRSNTTGIGQNIFN